MGDLTAKLARLRIATRSPLSTTTRRADTPPPLPDTPRALGRRRGAAVTPPIAGTELARLEEKLVSLPEREVRQLGVQLSRDLAAPLHAFDDAARAPYQPRVDAPAGTDAVALADAAACFAFVHALLGRGPSSIGSLSFGSMFAAAVFPIVTLTGAVAVIDDESARVAFRRMVAALEQLGVVRALPRNGGSR
jgi:hypothetical protein